MHSVIGWFLECLSGGGLSGISLFFVVSFVLNLVLLLHCIATYD